MTHHGSSLHLSNVLMHTNIRHYGSGVAQLFRPHLELHGLQKKLLATEEPFASNFMHSLSQLLKIRIAASTAIICRQMPDVVGQPGSQTVLRLFMNQQQDHWMMAVYANLLQQPVHALTDPPFLLTWQHLSLVWNH